MDEKIKGLSLVFVAYLTWGLLPLYWKLLSHVEAKEILTHRIIWSAVFLGVVLVLNGQLISAIRKFKDKAAMKSLATSSLLITINWLIYVWAIGKGYFIEAGLGYYICPLFTIALGRLILGEKLSGTKKIAVILTATGVFWKIIASGRLPMVALGLGISFAFYTLLRKKNPINSLEGLFIETILSFIPAVLYLSYLVITKQAAILEGNLFLNYLLIASGVVTALPLLLFAIGAPKVPLQTTAIFQFITPTLSTILGLLNGDSINPNQYIAYGFIWFGIIVYLIPSKNLDRVAETT